VMLAFSSNLRFLTCTFLACTVMASQSVTQPESEPLLCVGQTFASYLEFEEQLWKFQLKHATIFTVESSKTVKQINLLNAAKGAPQLPTELRYAYAKFCCKRGGPARTCTGTGARPLQS